MYKKKNKTIARLELVIRYIIPNMLTLTQLSSHGVVNF